MVTWGKLFFWGQPSPESFWLNFVSSTYSENCIIWNAALESILREFLRCTASYLIWARNGSQPITHTHTNRIIPRIISTIWPIPDALAFQSPVDQISLTKLISITAEPPPSARWSCDGRCPSQHQNLTENTPNWQNWTGRGQHCPSKSDYHSHSVGDPPAPPLPTLSMVISHSTIDLSKQDHIIWSHFVRPGQTDLPLNQLSKYLSSLARSQQRDGIRHFKLHTPMVVLCVNFNLSSSTDGVGKGINYQLTIPHIQTVRQTDTSLCNCPLNVTTTADWPVFSFILIPFIIVSCIYCFNN